MSTTDVHVTVTIRDSQQPPAWPRAVAVVLTVVLVAWALGWLGWLVTAVALYVAARVGCAWYVRAQAAAERERERLAAVAARADQQHAWCWPATTAGCSARIRRPVCKRRPSASIHG